VPVLTIVAMYSAAAAVAAAAAALLVVAVVKDAFNFEGVSSHCLLLLC